MKKIKVSNFIINLIGAIVIFVVFAADPFIDNLVDGSSFLFPWWGWGIVGVLIFEMVCCIISLKISFNKDK